MFSLLKKSLLIFSLSLILNQGAFSAYSPEDDFTDETGNETVYIVVVKQDFESFGEDFDLYKVSSVEKSKDYLFVNVDSKKLDFEVAEDPFSNPQCVFISGVSKDLKEDQDEGYTFALSLAQAFSNSSARSSGPFPFPINTDGPNSSSPSEIIILLPLNDFSIMASVDPRSLAPSQSQVEESLSPFYRDCPSFKVSSQ